MNAVMVSDLATWEGVDLSGILADIADGLIVRATPAILTRGDGDALVYAGKVNGIHGESGCGKTWTALLACAQVMLASGHVVYVDLEDSPQDIVVRLIDLGLDADTIDRFFHYLAPEIPFADGGETLLTLVADTNARLVIIDSTGEATALEGVNPNADEEIAGWFADVPKRIAKQGPAVVVLDHLPKAGSGDLWPIGSHRKRAAINGAQYLQETITPFAKEQAGSARLVCAKDRHGNYRAGQRVAVLTVEPGAPLSISLSSPEAAEERATAFRPTGFMERISRALETATDPVTFNGICDRVEGKRTHIRTAVDVLVKEGFVSTKPGPRSSTLHAVLRPFTEAGDREPVKSPRGPETTSDRFRSLRGEPGTSHITSSGNQSGTSGNQCPKHCTPLWQGVCGRCETEAAS